MSWKIPGKKTIKNIQTAKDVLGCAPSNILGIILVVIVPGVYPKNTFKVVILMSSVYQNTQKTTARCHCLRGVLTPHLRCYSLCLQGRCSAHGDSAYTLFLQLRVLLSHSLLFTELLQFKTCKSRPCNMWHLLFIIYNPKHFMYKWDYMHVLNVLYKAFHSGMWPIFYEQDLTTLRSPATFQCS